MPRCPRCTGFLRVGVSVCPTCGATFAPLEEGEEDRKRLEPRRDIPNVPEPEWQTTWGRRGAEVGFVVGLVACIGLAGVVWWKEWFLLGTDGSSWLVPLLLLLVSPLAAMYTGIALGSMSTIGEPVVKKLLGLGAGKKPDGVTAGAERPETR